MHNLSLNMSTQPNAGIPLFHKPSTTGYKLLELSPELVDLLESKDPPTLTISPSSSSAVLHAPSIDKSYSLRQKNTSNALILLSPTTVTNFSSSPPGGITTIATVHETIELVPIATSTTPGGEKGTEAAAQKPRGKWHEKFGKGR
ncbi:hypothetical protein QBC42DRAFT_261748 [Cladorrhinum samala]|uniref:Sister chromatid cohesion protein DCC1 n=1 Tax=Cladorrhinum samala TaxID=585594 RepID=A0AAV9HWS3_9PEZI|nr:hypothetical protein QBC42DRAFT_261748 [Cladorrhinum samala]